MLKAFVGATLIDGSGAPALANAVVVVQDEKIISAGRADHFSYPENTEIIRLDGHWILPGLIDAHVHLGRRSLDLRDRMFTSEALWAARATADLRKLLEAGFTTIRDCGGSIAVSLRKAIQEGSIPGPRIVAAGRFIERTGGADDPTFLPTTWAVSESLNAPVLVDGADQCRRAVRDQIRNGADFVKTCATGAAYTTRASRVDLLEWTDDEINAIVDEGHRRGVKVAVHAHAAAGIRQALDAGADTIEHGTLIDAECCRIMAARGAYLVPTFLTLHRMAMHGGSFGAPDFAVEKSRDLDRAHQETFQLALRHGVEIAMGTDCGGAALNPHGINAEEIALMVEAGMAPDLAIQAATSNAARAIGLGTETGTLAPGFAADLIAVGADPLADVRALLDVRLVVKSGSIVADRRLPNP